MKPHSEELPGGPAAARLGRRLVDERLGRHLDDGTRYDLRVLVSELVTNAVRHGAASQSETIGLTMHLGRSHIRIEVCDPGPGFEPPRRPRARVRSSGGNGLVLLDRIASRWGVARGRRNCVWFEMELA